MSGSKHPILRCGPVVCAVGREYQIMVPVNCEALISVTVNGNEYYDHANGVRRSGCPVQRFTVPMEELDAAGEYTLHYCRVLKRLPYSCLKGPTVSRRFLFSPLRKTTDIHIYALSDCHGIKKEAIAAASYFGEDLDLLILNGDISSSCMTLDEALLPYDIAFGVTQGRVPVIITRGNHDLRGTYSERLHELMPSQNGRMYYSVELGPLWLLVLDCGEDKDDSHREYSGTAAYHSMRQEESVFLNVIAKGVRSSTGDQARRIVISHIPVSFRDRGSKNGEQPFDIEEELYDGWTSVLNREIRPELYIAGHLHRTELWEAGSDKNGRKLDCPVLITGKPVFGRKKNMLGAALTLNGEGFDISFTDQSGRIVATGSSGACQA